MATNNAINNPGNLFLVPANNLSDVASVTTASYNLNSAGYNIFSISTTTGLTNANFGQQIVCTGALPYTVTLPTVIANANRYVDFSIRTTSHALVTIMPASGLINGESSIILGTHESCRLETDGTNWYLSDIFLQPVNAQVVLSVNQAIPSAVVTKVNFDTKNWDIGNFYDNVTNFRYTPLYPGKYNMSSMIIFDAVATLTAEDVYLYKNGSVSFLSEVIVDASIVTGSLVINSDFVMNGSTDFLETFCFQNSGAPLNLSSVMIQVVNFNRISLF